MECLYVALIADLDKALRSAANLYFNKPQYGPVADGYRKAIRLNTNLAHAHCDFGMALLRRNNQKAAD